jgi:hypothetical protein
LNFELGIGFETRRVSEKSVETSEKVVLKRYEENLVEAWLKEATGVAKGKTTTVKVMRLTRGD